MYDKGLEKVLGFANLTSIEQDLQSLNTGTLPTPVAKQMLVIMVQSIYSELSFPLAHFATTGEL